MKYFIKEFDTRYFAGIEFPDGINTDSDDVNKVPDLWDTFFENVSENIVNKVEPFHCIGLEIYPFDFNETKTYYYYVLVETNELIEESDFITTKKLKKGKYICFPIEFDQISEEIQRVYQYIKREKIKVHMGFDYEDYLPDEDYTKSGAILNFCLRMEDDHK